MRKFAVVSVLLFLSAITAFAQDQRQQSPQRDTVYVGADGKFEAAPDTALVQFNIAAQEPELQAAHTRATNAAEQVRQALRANGIDPKEAEIGSFQVAPVYDWKNPKRKVVGYRVSSSISLKLKDFSKIGALASKFAELDVTESQSINYLLDNIDAAKVKAVEDAFQRAKASAEAIGRAGGRQIGQLSYASVDTFEPVYPMRAMATDRMMTMKAQGAPAPTEEFTPQKITVTAHVNALFTLK
jgi:uncharacterized protein YggE